MGKAVDETWTAEPGDDGAWDVGVDGRKVGEFTEEARASLAACAPAMARMLLAREWYCRDPGYDVEHCAEGCGAARYKDVIKQPHDVTCPWLVLMRQIGAR